MRNIYSLDIVTCLENIILTKLKDNPATLHAEKENKNYSKSQTERIIYIHVRQLKNTMERVKRGSQ